MLTVEFFDQSIAISKLLIPPKLKHSPINLPHILLLPDSIQILLQSQQLTIFLLTIERQNGYAVINLMQIR